MKAKGRSEICPRNAVCMGGTVPSPLELHVSQRLKAARALTDHLTQLPCVKTRMGWNSILVTMDSPVTGTVPGTK